jgi:hypothetical protein
LNQGHGFFVEYPIVKKKMNGGYDADFLHTSVRSRFGTMQNAWMH